MLIQTSTQISQLRYIGIVDNMVFSILRSNGIRNVEDVIQVTDSEALGLRDYILKSLKSFLKQMIMYEGTIGQAREAEKTNHNPQLTQAMEDALTEEVIAKEKAEGNVLFDDVIDLVSFLLIDSDDEYYSWLEQKGIDDNKEADCLPTTYRIMMEVRQNLFSVNKHNLYLRLLDHVMRHDRFRNVARQYRMENGTGNMSEYRPRQNSFFGNRGRDDRFRQRDYPNQQNAYRGNGRWDSGRPSGEERGNNPFADFFRGQGQQDGFREESPRNDWRNQQEMRREQFFPQQPTDREMPMESAPAFMALTPFNMVDDEEAQQKASDFYKQYGHYPMFSLLLTYLKTAKVVGTVRMASVVGAFEDKEKEDWLKIETRRRYVDGINRGLELPADPGLHQLLRSGQWQAYGLYDYDYLSEANYPFAELCQKEGLDISFNLFAFIVCLITRKAMINVQSARPREDELISDGVEGRKFTYVLPAEFANFLYSSFITIAGNRISELKANRENYKEYVKSALSTRFWRGEKLERKQRIFLKIIKDMLADVHGLYANDKTLVEEINIDDLREMERISRQRVTIESLTGQKPKRHYAHREGKLTIMDAILLVIKESDTPLTQSEIVEKVKDKQASDNDSSIKVILTTAKKSGKIITNEDGTFSLADQIKPVE